MKKLILIITLAISYLLCSQSQAQSVDLLNDSIMSVSKFEDKDLFIIEIIVYQGKMGYFEIEGDSTSYAEADRITTWKESFPTNRARRAFIDILINRFTDERDRYVAKIDDTVDRKNNAVDRVAFLRGKKDNVVDKKDTFTTLLNEER